MFGFQLTLQRVSAMIEQDWGELRHGGKYIHIDLFGYIDTTLDFCLVAVLKKISRD
jgi:hypothetical protein